MKAALAAALALLPAARARALETLAPPAPPAAVVLGAAPAGPAVERLLARALDAQAHDGELPDQKAAAWCALAAYDRGENPYRWPAREACEAWRLYEGYFAEALKSLLADYRALRAAGGAAEWKKFEQEYRGLARAWPKTFGWAVEHAARRAAGEAAPSPEASPSFRQAIYAAKLESEFGPPEVLGPAPALVRVPAGPFVMGADDGDAAERPAREVRLDAYAIDAHEVTVGEYAQCVKAGACAPVPGPGPYCTWGLPGHEADALNCVNWFEARRYCAWRGKTLPTEAQWEKAARAGTRSRFHFGDDPAAADAYAWTIGNSGNRVRPVMTRRPNAWGVYDMHGNLWEWTADWYQEDYYSRAPASNPRGPGKGALRVLRGGSWLYPPIPAAARHGQPPSLHAYSIGFRCAAEGERP